MLNGGIESGIPVPYREQRIAQEGFAPGEDMLTIQAMRPGDSIVRMNPQRVQAAMRRLGWKAKQKKQETGYRIWRVS